MSSPEATDGPLRPRGLVNRLVASRRFQAFCSRVPGLRGLSRREGAALFDLMQGFVNTQTLLALVELRILHRLAQGPATAAALAPGLEMSEQRLGVLLQAGAAMGLLRRKGAGFALARRGAAFLGVAGLDEMVRHNAVLYRDLLDPVAFFRGTTAPELARFWPYVFGADGPMDPAVATRYSRLMADSQTLVAEEALAHLRLGQARRLMDVGGGTGAFLRAVRARHPTLGLALFDLPQVVAQAPLPADVERHGGSFRDGPLPGGADVISLVRVLYDHGDETVKDLLAKVHAALPPGGRVLIIEPMSGGSRPDPQVDVYFSVYTMAMETGRTRSAAEIVDLLKQAGLNPQKTHKTQRPFITGVIEAQKPSEAGRK